MCTYFWKIVVIAMTDYSIMEMAVNLYEYSFAKLSIANYLLICVDKQAFSILQSLGINWYLYTNTTTGNKELNYHTKKFANKVHKQNINVDSVWCNVTLIPGTTQGWLYNSIQELTVSFQLQWKMQTFKYRLAM